MKYKDWPFRFSAWLPVLSFSIMLLTIVAVLLLTACQGMRPSCYDNPRNMACMTGEQLQKELAK